MCSTSTETLTNQGVFVQGVEANWFLSFVRIKDRVQAGLGVGVGIGTFNGDVHKVTTGTEYNFVTNPNGAYVLGGAVAMLTMGWLVIKSLIDGAMR